MTLITHARKKSRLAKMIDSAGGISIGVALGRARENIAALRSRGLEELAALAPPGRSEDTFAALQQVYRSANHVIDAAAPFELEEICAVAISLCDVIDRIGEDPAPDWRIVDVHIQSLRLLNGLPSDDAGERHQVIDQLSRMVSRKLG